MENANAQSTRTAPRQPWVSSINDKVVSGSGANPQSSQPRSPDTTCTRVKMRSAKHAPATTVVAMPAGITAAPLLGGSTGVRTWPGGGSTT